MGNVIANFCDLFQRKPDNILKSKLIESISKSTTISNNNSPANSTKTSFRSNNTTDKIDINDFKILKLLGRGSFGKVHLVTHKERYYAMKVLNKEKLVRTNQILNTRTERDILEKVNHPFIVKLHYAFQTDLKLYLVTEFMQGGELFFHLKKNGPFDEDITKLYACELILALEYLHQKKIIYRDLKPENILLGVDGHIKITDFGLSKYFHNFNDDNFSDDKAYTICGTPEYLAPEILLGKGYDKTSDWWSLGILLYEMLLEASHLRKSIKFDINNYFKPFIIKDGKISDNARDLILKLLVVDPSKRLGYGVEDARSIKSHSFFNGVDWDNVHKKLIKPKFIPTIKNKEDLDYFDKYFTEEDINKSSIVKDKNIKFNHLKNSQNFENFSYILSA